MMDGGVPEAFVEESLGEKRLRNRGGRGGRKRSSESARELEEGKLDEQDRGSVWWPSDMLARSAKSVGVAYDRYIRPIEYVNPKNILKIIKTGISIPDKANALNRVEKLKDDILEDIEKFNHPTNFEYAIADYIVVKYIDYPTQKEFSDRNKGDLLLCQQNNRSLEVRLQEEVKKLQQEKTLVLGQHREVVRRIRENENLVENLAKKNKEIASLQQKLKQQELDIQKERKINKTMDRQLKQLRRHNVAYPDSSNTTLIAEYQRELDEMKQKESKVSEQYTQELEKNTALRQQIEDIESTHKQEVEGLEEKCFKGEIAALRASENQTIDEILARKKDEILARKKDQSIARKKDEILARKKEQSIARKKDVRNTKLLLMERAVRVAESVKRRHEEKKKNRTIFSKIKRVFTRKPVSQTPVVMKFKEIYDNEKKEEKKKAMQEAKKNKRKAMTPPQPTLVRPQRKISK